MEKKLTLNTAEKKIFGICSGIAKYCGIDPFFIRSLYVLLFLFFPFGIILAYVLLYFIIPSDSNGNK